MNFSKQLKKYRELNGFSQEVLSEKIYVTRQTISKWENDKSYPDIHNLLALSLLFDISLDELVKGDVTIMKNVVANKQMDNDTKRMLFFIVLVLVIGVPSVVIWGSKGFIPLVILWGIAMYFAIKLERAKRKHDIKTFKEIIAFSEGKSNLEELKKKRSNTKYLREKIMIVLSFTLIVSVLALIITYLTEVLLKL